MNQIKKLKYLFRKNEILKLLHFFDKIGFSIFISHETMTLYASEGFELKKTMVFKTIPLVEGLAIEVRGYSRIPEYVTYTDSILDMVILGLNVSDSLIDVVQTIARQWKIINFHSKIVDSIDILSSIEKTGELLLRHLLSIVSVKRASILVQRDDKFFISASIGLPEHIKKLKYLEMRGLAGWSFQNNRTLIINSDRDLSEELQEILISRALNKHSFEKRFVSEPIMIIPLEIGDKVLGVLNLTNKIDHTPFNSEDIKIISSISKEISMYINSVDLITEIKKGEQLKKELSLAAKIQEDILPKEFPSIKNLDFFGKNIAPNQVGGDYFDYFLEDQKYLYLVIADISGHNFSSALLVNNFRSYLKAFLKSKKQLKELVEEINRFICEEVGDSGRFITSTIVKVNIDTGDISYVNSGHNPPFILKNNGDIFYLKTGGMPLGFFEDLKYSEFQGHLDKDDLLILFTDGFEEAESATDGFLGKERFIKICKKYKSKQAQEVIESIFEELKIFTNGKIEDDLTAVGLKYVK